jgi:hypothetical protein
MVKIAADFKYLDTESFAIHEASRKERA